jgi:hypothetical protein
VTILARLLLVVALLFAQTGGVVHEIWHSTTELAAGGKAPQKSPLCDFHSALGNVLGALDCAASQPQLDAQSPVALAAADAAPARFSPFVSRSRGPPALL